jgi:hypothetical protein
MVGEIMEYTRQSVFHTEKYTQMNANPMLRRVVDSCMRNGFMRPKPSRKRNEKMFKWFQVYMKHFQPVLFV